MGQAKLRGSHADRVAQAQKKIDEIRPEKLVCNNCNTSFTEFQLMDTRGLKGINAVFAGICPSCNHETFAFSGDPDAVAHLASTLEETIGTESLLGAQSKSGESIK